MSITRIDTRDERYPELLREIASPPKQLYIAGHLEVGDYPAVAIVGSRKHSTYGQEATERLAGELAAAGITIVSGLALGIDAIAHRAAIEAGGYTIAVQACGLDRIYPATNRQLGVKIIESGGAIISEYGSGTPPLKQHFPARNRIVSGLCQGVIVTEARESSGALITANFALEQNRQVMAVPGHITSTLSAGTNNLIKAGAVPVTDSKDVLAALGLAADDLDKPLKESASPEEAAVLELIEAGINDSDELIKRLEWRTSEFNRVATLMELSGKIRSIGNGKWIRL